jgi:hypothetical protein
MPTDFRKQVEFYAIIVGLAAALITVGYNWRRVDELAMAQERSEQEHKDFVRKDVAMEQYNALTYQIAELKRLLLEEQARR